MHAVWACALKDLRRQIRDPISLVLSLGIPLVIATLIVLAFGGSGGGPPPRARLLVADEDASLLSGMLVRGLRETPVIEVERVAREEGQARMDKGEATALLVVPNGFGQAVIDDQPTTLRIVTNPSQRILPAMVQEMLGAFAEVAFYGRSLLDEPLRVARASPLPPGSRTLPDQSVATVSVMINHLIARVGPYVFPPTIALETTVEEGEGQSRSSLGQIFLPGMLFMALLFTVQGQSADVWREHQQGTLRRALTTPQGVRPLLAGKIVAGMCVMAVVSLATLLFGVGALGGRLRAVPLALGWATFSGGVFLVLLTLLQLVASSQRGANMLINLMLFPLMMIGGSFFPFEAMPPTLAAIGRRTPNGWAIGELRRILDGAVQPAELLLAFAALAGVGALAFWLASRRLQRGFLGS